MSPRMATCCAVKGNQGSKEINGQCEEGGVDGRKFMTMNSGTGPVPLGALNFGSWHMMIDMKSSFVLKLF